MASLIKNQILKHLSKFAKNLSHDQIHLSTLKGEGELTNLELNDQESILMNLFIGRKVLQCFILLIMSKIFFKLQTNK
jgi:hypothetical protein